MKSEDMISRPCFFYALIEHAFTDPHESHQNLNLNDVYKNLRQKPITIPDCKNDKYLQPSLLGKIEEIKLNRSGWRFFIKKKQSMDATLSKLDITGSTSYVELSKKHKSIINVKSTKNSRANW